MKSPSPADFLEVLWKFAALHLGDPDLATASVAGVVKNDRDAFEDLVCHPRRRCSLISALRRRCMRMREQRPGAVHEPKAPLHPEDAVRAATIPEEQWCRTVASLPEPQKSVAILFYLKDFDTLEIGHITGLHPHEVGRALSSARGRLASAFQSASGTIIA